MPRCTICGETKQSVNSLRLHLKIFHKSYNDLFKCKEDDCYRVYKCWGDFRKHLIKEHKSEIRSDDLLQENLEPTVNVHVGGSSNVEYVFGKQKEKYIPIKLETSLPTNFSLDIEKTIEKIALNYVCKLYADPKLNRSHVQKQVEDISQLLKDVFSTIKPYLKSTENPENYESRFKKVTDAVMKPFQTTLSTEYLRMRAIEKTEKYVKARDYVIGDRFENILHQGRVIKDRTSVTAEFIPMRDVLKNFLSMPGVLSKITDYLKYLEEEKERGIISNFVQGELWQEKKKEFGDKFVLPIFVYYDDFEINNPLGSHAGVNKIGATYYSIPCLPPEFRGKVENIFTAGLFNANDRKSLEEGNDAVFGIVVEELNFLFENGVELNIEGTISKVYFALGLLLGDNEALNSSGGFQEGPNATMYCRVCKMTKDENHKNCPLRDDHLRSPQQYEEDGFQNPKKTGVKENSIWNLVFLFHIVQNFFFDLAHDLLEGVCKYDMQHILYELIYGKEKSLNLDALNEKLLSFNYEKNGFTNKPPPIKADEVKHKKLHMSASEMRTFVLIFPIICSDIIKGGINMKKKIWQLFALLRQIMDICFAKSLRSEMLDVLDTLITRHHDLYIELFNDTLKPKFHNMRHFKLAIKMSGPLSHLSLLRFESKHRELKTMISSTTSRKNPCHTIAVKEQLRLCYRFLANQGLVSNFEYGETSSLESIFSLPIEKILHCDSIPSMLLSGPCLNVSWVKFNGVKYKTNSFIMLDVDCDGYIIFGKILNIVISENQKIFFVCEKAKAESFNTELQAYTVLFSNDITFLSIENLLHPHVVIHYRLPDGQDVVAVRYTV